MRAGGGWSGGGGGGGGARAKSNKGGVTVDQNDQTEFLIIIFSVGII